MRQGLSAGQFVGRQHYAPACQPPQPAPAARAHAPRRRGSTRRHDIGSCSGWRIYAICSRGSWAQSALAPGGMDIAASRSSGTRPLSTWCGSWADGEPDDPTPVWSSPGLGDDRRGMRCPGHKPRNTPPAAAAPKAGGPCSGNSRTWKPGSPAGAGGIYSPECHKSDVESCLYRRP
jgi:hypothetical protein